MAKTVTTRDSEMWDAISYRVWRSEFYMDQLMAANPAQAGVIAFDAGTVLIVPDVTSPPVIGLPAFMFVTKVS